MSHYDFKRNKSYMSRTDSSPSFTQSRNPNAYQSTRYAPSRTEQTSPQFESTKENRESKIVRGYEAEEVPKPAADRKKSRLEILKETPCYLIDSQPFKKTIVSGSGPAYRKEAIEKSENLLYPEERDQNDGTGPHSNSMDFSTTNSSRFSSSNFTRGSRDRASGNSSYTNRYETPREYEGGFKNGSESTLDDENNRWKCQVCEGHNFLTKGSCFRCEAPKPIDEILRIPITKLGPPGLFKEGDWQCFNCRNVNFKNRQTCNKCSEPKPVEYIQREKENQTYEQTNQNFGKMSHQYFRNESNQSGTTFSQSRHPTGGYQSQKSDWRTNNFQDNQNKNSNDRSRSRSFVQEKNTQDFATNHSSQRFGNPSQGKKFGGFDKPRTKNYLL